ncbi:SctK family type III secretion system sorting platform protein [Pseudomonas mosselii]|uniref:SctK family type III secretion system sorting platform protein n=1 Tax=Pseudomonas mosselii TaxID=78327 RepID=UPI000BB46F16|nr:SctK family type III secretion system sorting platform protein [Pseudomonas mosselii]ATB67963.1 type III export protein PscK [Pseudomonas mosselii]MDH1099752.1 Yop proteins translocation protein K [Pseudomonas mosselii]MEB5934192.1 Yop proteins translocation protein K [Pseudomonas mosselii]UVN46071.1 Yop proteins translocation protein K [Pseudomonas mosselii]
MTEFQLRFCPAHYLHMTHCPEVLGQAIQALPHWRESGAVNGWLISVLELSEPFDMPGRLGRLALFAQPALEQVLSSLGGLLHGQAIQQVLDRPGHSRLRLALDPQGLRYCLEQWRLVIGPWPADWQQALPDGELDAYLRGCGLAFWLQACGEVDPGFARRLALRLPGMPGVPTWPMDDEQRGLARILCMKVARDRSPECCHLLS